MNIESFYTFSSKLSSATFQAHAINLSTEENKTGLFDHDKLMLGMYAGISFPVIFRQAYGRKLEDVLDTGWPGLFLISSKLKKTLLENLLTGWNTFDIKLIDKKGEEIPGYFGFSTTGRCGKVDFSKSEIIEKRYTISSKGMRYYQGLHVGLDEWDDSDFFLPANYLGTIVTSKAAEVLRVNNLTNMRFLNLIDIQTPILDSTEG